MKQNIVFRRFVAYLIDFFIVAGIASCISYISFLNPQKDAYEEKYNEVLSLYERLEQDEISQEEFTNEYISLYYDLNHLDMNYVVINLIVLIAYFGVFQWQGKGQTLGKRLMKIRVVSKDEKKPVGWVSYLIRTVVLNNIIITLLQIAILYFYDINSYYPIYSNINLVGYVLIYIILFLFLIRKDHRGLHDLIAGTNVVFTEEIGEEKKEEIPEATFEEVTEKPLEKPNHSKEKNTQKKKTRKSKSTDQLKK